MLYNKEKINIQKREIYLTETSFQSYTPTGPDSNCKFLKSRPKIIFQRFLGVASKYRHNEHIVEYELCHRSIVDEKLIRESPPTSFLSKEVPSNGHLSNPISVDSGSDPLSHDILPSESNLNTAINHDSDGFSDSGEFGHYMLGLMGFKRPELR